jgi:tRNA G18 (ribose-2'-O)-methylase SpoU
LGAPLARVRAEPPVVLCLGAEREGLSERSRAEVATFARIPLREGGPESLGVAAAAAIALYERTRMAEDA